MKQLNLIALIMLGTIMALLPIGLFANANKIGDDVAIKTQIKTQGELIIEIVLNKTITKRQKDKKFSDIADKVFDYKVMGRIALGKTYKKLNKKQKKIYTKAFTNLLKQAYISKFYSYKDEKIIIDNVKKLKKNKFLLKSSIVGNGKTITIDYKIYKPKKAKKNKHKYLIYDVSIFGISLTKSYKSQFRQAIKSNGINKFVENLHKKATQITKAK
jgi:phospholipid transport system substrate-binding protein